MNTNSGKFCFTCLLVCFYTFSVFMLGVVIPWLQHCCIRAWGIGTVFNKGNTEYIYVHCKTEVLVSYEPWQGAAAVVCMAFCEDYPSLGIRALCWLVLLEACHFASSTGCLLGITPVQWWISRTRISGKSWSWTCLGVRIVASFRM